MIVARGDDSRGRILARTPLRLVPAADGGAVASAIGDGGNDGARFEREENGRAFDTVFKWNDDRTVPRADRDIERLGFSRILFEGSGDFQAVIRGALDFVTGTAGTIGFDDLRDELEDAAAVARARREALVRFRRAMLDLNTAVGMRILP